VPSILRDAILAAEDKNFFTHSGVDYRALPRVIHKTATSSVRGWRNRDGFRLRFPRVARRSRSSSCAGTSCRTGGAARTAPPARCSSRRPAPRARSAPAS
jgi:hypothetical protein